MIWASLCFAFCGVCMLSASMTRHRRDLPQTQLSKANPLLLRSAGWVFLLGALAASGHVWPFWQGVVAWIFIAGIAALALVLLLAFRPTWLWKTYFLSMFAGTILSLGAAWMSCSSSSCASDSIDRRHKNSVPKPGELRDWEPDGRKTSGRAARRECRERRRAASASCGASFGEH